MRATYGPEEEATNRNCLCYQPFYDSLDAHATLAKTAFPAKYLQSCA